MQRDQERASSELAAARSVQELMIPQEQMRTPGFEVESIYNPANEVGGDFFHVQSTEDGGLLVIIGDVAGKGLKAAMNVSMLMGALRRTPDQSPGKILESLNRVLAGSESFTTCQAAYFCAQRRSGACQRRASAAVSEQPGSCDRRWTAAGALSGKLHTMRHGSICIRATAFS